MERLDPNIESNSPEFLVPEFREKVVELINQCSRLKVEVVLGCTVRGPRLQGRMWCRSRTTDDVLKRKEVLESAGAPTMASCLSVDMASLGFDDTQTLPGQSWHQWGEAVDIAVKLGGRLTWSGSPFQIVVDVAHDLGLTSAQDFYVHRRRHHIQLRPQKNPLLIRGFCDSWADVEREMGKRFLDVPSIG